MLGIVYLLHFERPISDKHTCQHYTGWALDLNARLTMHRAGQGARLTQIAVERGIGFEVVRTWPGSREFERYLKNRKDAPRLCPMCCQAHGRRCPVVSAATQLTLPLDIEPAPDFPELPYTPMDWIEISATRRWSQARSAGAINLTAIDDLL
jgi:predicted GIY-YIG superfamily endonuclease